MNSFTLTAVGQLARNPEVVAKSDLAYTRFCLVGNDYGGKDEEGATRELVTSIWFVAFGAAGEAIAHHARKGDQLIVEARVRANIWTDKQGDKQYDHSFVVQGFRFGAPGRAKRDEREGRREHTLGLPRGENRGSEQGATVEVVAGATAEASEVPDTGSNAAVAAGDGRSAAVDAGAVGNVAADADGAAAATASANTSNSKSRAARSSRKSLVSAA
jgi:single-strand DNA-binding protein